MPSNSGGLLVHCQQALGLTQQELGELLGCTKRTIQRWQDTGFAPGAHEAETLAHALQPLRPDLADQVVELRRKLALAGGMTPPVVPATAEVIDGILRAAADAAGTSPEAIRPAILAALLEADGVGVDVKALVAGLKSAR